MWLPRQASWFRFVDSSMFRLRAAVDSHVQVFCDAHCIKFLLKDPKYLYAEVFMVCKLSLVIPLGMCIAQVLK